MSNIPYQTIDFAGIESEEHPGSSATSFWQLCQFPGLRIRQVEYTSGYIADHWCKKGHIVYCIEGEFISELENGDESVLKAGMFYIVSDELSSHRSRTEKGARLLIIDGDFLRLSER